MSDTKYSYIYIIADRKQKDIFEKELFNAGGALIDIVFGRGYHESSHLWEFLGFQQKSGKVVITSLIKREKGNELINLLNEKYLFKNSGTGIAFTIPVESIVY